MPRFHPSSRLTPGGLALALTACGGSAPPEPAPAPAPERIVTVVHDTVVRVDSVIRRDPALDDSVARLELALAERGAQVDALQGEVAEARLEVVRTMAKLRSGATRAEAAAAMAEAELAVRALGAAEGPELTRELAGAREVLIQSNAAFASQNYSGAMYLANQAKVAASKSQARVAGISEDGLRRGERLFAVPVRFRVVRRSNLRDGPGTGERLVTTLEGGTVLQAESYLGDWLRVHDEAGHAGWIFRDLVTQVGAGR